MKRSGAHFLDQSDLLRQTLEETYEGLQIFAPDWTYLYVNQAGAKHGNTTREKLIGKTLLECYPGIENTQVFKRMHCVQVERKPDNFENYFEYLDGGGCWFELFIEPHPKGILVRTVDITKRKELESRYYQALKMETIGQLAGGVAHDFNNKLGIMLMYCELALEQEGMTPKIHKYLKHIHDSIQESSDLTQKLLAFSRRQVMDLKVISLNNMLRSHLDGLRGFLEDNIEIRENLSSNLAHVKVDPIQLGQAVLNLILNARDALAEGGVITVETDQVHIEGPTHEGKLDAPPGEYVKFSVSDNGVGISQQDLDKVFDPFYTTKERGKGTGLGLSSVHGIVKQCHGHIVVESEPDEGTTFSIYFPAVDKEVDEKVKESFPESPLLKGDETILIIEDDESLGKGCSEVLNTAGYKTWYANHPSKALDLFLEYKDQIDIVLTDLIMPQLNGDKLMEVFREHKPDLKVIYTSGYTQGKLERDSTLKENFVLMQKPITSRTLLSTLRAVLDGRVTKGVF